MPPWDDLPLFLAAWRTRSLARAAATLGVSSSTASRRLTQLEQSLGAPLFLRTPDGLAPTAAAQAILPQVEAMERASLRLQAALASLDEEVEGVVRIALPAEVAYHVLLPSLPPLLERHAGIRLELVAGRELVDLSRREADMAIRLVRPTSGEGLTVTRLREVVQQPFVHPRLLQDWGEHEDVRRLPWIGWTQAVGMNPLEAWMQAALPGVEPRVRVNEFYLGRRAAVLGMGACLLSRTFGLLSPPLVAIAEAHLPLPLPRASLWLVGLSALRDTLRYALVWDFLVEVFRTPPEQDDIAVLRERISGQRQGP